MTIQLQENMRILGPTGQSIGRLDRVVYHPRTKQVTHLVVLGKFEGSDRKVIPFEWVEDSSEEEIYLRELPGRPDQLPDFEETHYVVTSERELLQDERSRDNAAPGLFLYPPIMPFGPTFSGAPMAAPGAFVPVTGSEEERDGVSSHTERNIPDDTVALREDADVITSDGKTVGDVERVIVQAETGRTTHFLISRGLVFKTEKLVPQDWVERVEEDRVYLAVDSDVLNRLPDYEGI